MRSQDLEAQIYATVPTERYALGKFFRQQAPVACIPILILRQETHRKAHVS